MADRIPSNFELNQKIPGKYIGTGKRRMGATTVMLLYVWPLPDSIGNLMLKILKIQRNVYNIYFCKEAQYKSPLKNEQIHDCEVIRINFRYDEYEA
ncbi:hypothetical protein AJ79_01915 [Helicocarpus griseus UAMH5409]|uniref:Uncharacterized protein n=1 Tax=Helicocarpus griseus UAMH5409 TaxID=1447875 RepID=A0A2B7Y5I1_9EURO|nr:hypothetical protein AJ79_01915 [Helicocarpus griseus UAMH5409]